MLIWSMTFKKVVALESVEQTHVQNPLNDIFDQCNSMFFLYKTVGVQPFAHRSHDAAWYVINQNPIFPESNAFYIRILLAFPWLAANLCSTGERPLIPWSLANLRACVACAWVAAKVCRHDSCTTAESWEDFGLGGGWFWRTDRWRSGGFCCVFSKKLLRVDERLMKGYFFACDWEGGGVRSMNYWYYTWNTFYFADLCSMQMTNLNGSNRALAQSSLPDQQKTTISI